MMDKERAARTDIPTLQWFPGHMKKAQRLIEENLKLVDVVIELLDARIPASSANPMLAEIIKDKPRLIALNKADLADSQSTKKWLAYFRAQGIPAVAIDSMKGKGMKQLVKEAEELARPKTEKFVAKGARARAARCMILGIPNVGKSSLINRLAGAVKAKAANQPGVTRAKQWIKIGSNLDLLDTPGILWPKFDDREVGMKLALVGSMRDEITDSGELAAWLIRYLEKEYPDVVEKRYDVLPDNDVVTVLRGIARRRGCLKAGGEEDLEKASKTLIDDFRSGRLGKITLEKV